MRLLFVSFLMVLVAGCAQPRYNWGGYNSYLYSYYENPQAAESFREAMESHLNYLESAGKTPPPGLYAELGTLYLEKGDTSQAIAFYEKERQTWPESGPLMTSLISSLNKEQTAE